MMYKYCYYNSENYITICLINKKISLKVLPFVYIKVVSLLYFGIRWDALFGLIIAII